MFNIIAGINNINGIGCNGSIPWKNKEDMIFFKKITSNTNNKLKENAIIMGRKTFESLNEKPLPLRTNFVISRKKYDNVESFESLDLCLEYIKKMNNIERIYVIGGSQLYKEALNHDSCVAVFLNKIDDDSFCDTFFPKIDENKYKKLSTLVISESVTSILYGKY